MLLASPVPIPTRDMGIETYTKQLSKHLKPLLLVEIQTVDFNKSKYCIAHTKYTTKTSALIWF